MSNPISSWFKPLALEDKTQFQDVLDRIKNLGIASVLLPEYRGDLSDTDKYLIEAQDRGKSLKDLAITCHEKFDSEREGLKALNMPTYKHLAGTSIIATSCASKTTCGLIDQLECDDKIENDCKRLLRDLSMDYKVYSGPLTKLISTLTTLRDRALSCWDPNNTEKKNRHPIWHSYTQHIDAHPEKMTPGGVMMHSSLRKILSKSKLNWPIRPDQLRLESHGIIPPTETQNKIGMCLTTTKNSYLPMILLEESKGEKGNTSQYLEAVKSATIGADENQFNLPLKLPIIKVGVLLPAGTTFQPLVDPQHFNNPVVLKSDTTELLYRVSDLLHPAIQLDIPLKLNPAEIKGRDITRAKGSLHLTVTEKSSKAGKVTSLKQLAVMAATDAVQLGEVTQDERAHCIGPKGLINDPGLLATQADREQQWVQNAGLHAKYDNASIIILRAKPDALPYDPTTYKPMFDLKKVIHVIPIITKNRIDAQFKAAEDKRFQLVEALRDAWSAYKDNDEKYSREATHPSNILYLKAVINAANELEKHQSPVDQAFADQKNKERTRILYILNPQARREAEEQARMEAEEQEQREAEEQARREREAEEQALRDADRQDTSLLSWCCWLKSRNNETPDALSSNPTAPLLTT